MAVGAAGLAGRFEIARRNTYPSHAQAFRQKIKNQQMTAVANAANTMFGAISSESAGLFEIAIVQATNRAKQELAAKVADVTA
jgi:Tfp pilus assembly protein FimV